MKKKLLFALSAAITVVALFFALTGCKEEKSELEKFKEKTSFRQDTLFTAHSDGFNVSLSSGISEQGFIIDGKVGDVKPWTTLKLMPKTASQADKKFAYKLIGDKGELSGEFKKDMLGVSYSAEITEVTAVGIPTKVLITSDDVSEELPLENKMTGINADKALEIAIGEFRTQIDGSEDGVNREIYIKYINDRHNSESPYCWYVSFIAGNEDFWAALIAEDGTVISKRV